MKRRRIIMTLDFPDRMSEREIDKLMTSIVVAGSQPTRWEGAHSLGVSVSIEAVGTVESKEPAN